MFGFFSGILAWLGQHLGFRDETASATGSLHAKMANLVANVIGTSSHTRANNTVMGWLASPVKSIQRGTYQFNNSGSGDKSYIQSITAVDMNKAILLVSDEGDFTGGSYSDAANAGHIVSNKVRGTLTSATQITFTRGDYHSRASVSWQVIEFY